MVTPAPKPKAAILACVSAVPCGRVTTFDAIAAHAGIATALVATVLDQLSDDEREIVPWHRVVAKGGAIGRGAHRDRQFALLVREGVCVSPASVVQDMTRVVVTDFSGRRCEPSVPATQAGRSRGMKARP